MLKIIVLIIMLDAGVPLDGTLRFVSHAVFATRAECEAARAKSVSDLVAELNQKLLEQKVTNLVFDVKSSECGFDPPGQPV